MRRVIKTKSCPQCGGEYISERNYDTGEEWSVCTRCGKGDSLFFVRDEKGNVVVDKEGKPKIEKEEHKGYGLVSLRYKDGKEEMLALRKPIDEEAKKIFYEIIKRTRKIDKKKTYFTYVDYDTDEVKAEYGTLPALFEDMEVVDDG